MNRKQLAIVKKDIGALAANKRYFYTLCFLPLIFTIVFPTIFVVTFHFAPQDPKQIAPLLKLLPQTLQKGSLETSLMSLFVNAIMPLFFLMIPIMVASIMSASAFVGEKEKRTLETLFYSPLSIQEIFQAKVFASMISSLSLTYLSFVIMVIVLEVESRLIYHTWIRFSWSWVAVLFLLVPAVTLIAIILIVKGSAKSQSIEESQQRAVFLVLPLLVFIISQFTGLFLVTSWLLAGAGILLLALAFALLRNSLRDIDYETLLR